MYHRRRPETRFEVPITLLDLFQLLLLMVLAFQVSSVKVARLPELLGGDQAAPEASPGPPPVLVELGVDGKAKLEGKEIALDSLADRLANEGAIRLAIETGPDGSGHLGGFLQIQADFSRRGLWARTAVLHRAKATVEPGEKP